MEQKIFLFYQRIDIRDEPAQPGRTNVNSGNTAVSVLFYIARCWLSSYALLAEFLGSIESIFHQACNHRLARIFI